MFSMLVALEIALAPAIGRGPVITLPAVRDTLPTIVAIFDAANTADIETGNLATKLGATKEVRDFGATLARDHQQVRQQGRDLAAKLGVKPTPPADDQRRQSTRRSYVPLAVARGGCVRPGVPRA